MVVWNLFPFRYQVRAPLVQRVVVVDREVFLDMTFEYLSYAQALDVVDLSGVEDLQVFKYVVSESHNGVCKCRHALNVDVWLVSFFS